MSLQIETDPTPLSTDAQGTIRVGGTPIALESVLWLYKQGYAAEAIAEAYPSISLADLYSVIAYYLRHKDGVDHYLHAREDEAEHLRADVEQSQGKQITRAELLERWAARSGGQGCSGS